MRVTVADFGNAMTIEDAALYLDDPNFEVQSLYYRAPEILLRLPFNTGIDMWSIGCILVEALTGTPLFGCRTKEKLLQKMVSILGPLPVTPFSEGQAYHDYFTEDHKLMIHMEESDRPLLVSQLITKSRDPIFVDFIMGLLEYDPQKRLSPLQALRHPFFVSFIAFV